MAKGINSPENVEKLTGFLQKVIGKEKQMKASKVEGYIVKGCENRKEAIAYLEKIVGKGAEFEIDVISSQKFADEGWTYEVNVFTEVKVKKGKGDE